MHSITPGTYPSGNLMRFTRDRFKLVGGSVGRSAGVAPEQGTSPRSAGVAPEQGTSPRDTGVAPEQGTSPRDTGVAPEQGTSPRSAGVVAGHGAGIERGTTSPRGTGVVPALGFRAIASLILVGAGLVALASAGVALGRWVDRPAVVADHATLMSATAALNFAGTRTLAQRVIPRHNALMRVDLLLAAESPGLPGDVIVSVEELPARRPIREARVPAASLPAGAPWSIGPGQPDERWTTFLFDPIPESDRRELLIVLSYPAGVDVPERRVGTLARLPNSYPGGELLINQIPTSGNLLFRLGALGTRGGALRAAEQNVVRQLPVASGSSVLPVLLAAICAALAVLIVARALAFGSSGMSGLRAGSGAGGEMSQRARRVAKEEKQRWRTAMRSR